MEKRVERLEIAVIALRSVSPELQGEKEHEENRNLMSKVDDTIKMIGDGLTEAEQMELVGLEYVLTWGYSDDLVKEAARYRELIEKKWKSREESEKDC